MIWFPEEAGPLMRIHSVAHDDSLKRRSAQAIDNSKPNSPVVPHLIASRRNERYTYAVIGRIDRSHRVMTGSVGSIEGTQVRGQSPQ